MEQTTNTNTNDLYSSLSKDNLEKLESLSRKVLNKEPRDLSVDEAILLIIADIQFLPTEVTISAGATRKTAEYCSNNYHLSEKIDLSDILSYVKEFIKDTKDIDRMMTLYAKYKAVIFLSIKDKMLSHEHFLRDTIRAMEESDKIKPLGRFN